MMLQFFFHSFYKLIGAEREGRTENSLSITETFIFTLMEETGKLKSETFCSDVRRKRRRQTAQ